MQVFVGLGNPGEKYALSRHNAGFMLADSLAETLGAKFESQRRVQGQLARTEQVMLLKPQTFMNGSGESVQQAIRYYQPGVLPRSKSAELQLRDVWVGFDDLDIPVGSIKIQFGKGPKVHNGLLSVYQHLGTEQFWHVRLGVDGRAGARHTPGHIYVLQDFLPDEKIVFEQELAQATSAICKEWGLSGTR